LAWKEGIGSGLTSGNRDQDTSETVRKEGGEGGGIGGVGGASARVVLNRGFNKERGTRKRASVPRDVVRTKKGLGGGPSRETGVEKGPENKKWFVFVGKIAEEKRMASSHGKLTL